jgi:phosphoethanolamine N-methyltransferase
LSGHSGEYSEEHIAGFEYIWGDGFMSPGGDKEVAAVVADIDVSKRNVLDFGCGLGGPTVLLATQHNANAVIGVDIQIDQVKRARAVAKAQGVSDRVSFQLVEPGPLPFGDSMFDLVFSMGALVQVRDKHSLFEQIFRTLRPGGVFRANDWVVRDTGQASDEMTSFMESACLTYNWTTRDKTNWHLKDVGFVETIVQPRTGWLSNCLHEDVEQLANGQPRYRMLESFGEASADDWSRSWRLLLALARRGELSTVFLHAAKPASRMMAA